MCALYMYVCTQPAVRAQTMLSALVIFQRQVVCHVNDLALATRQLCIKCVASINDLTDQNMDELSSA
jgi:hypothetical protein